MGRKNLLVEAISPELPAGNSPRETAETGARDAVSPPFGMGARGAIGAVARSFELLKSHAIAELPPALIDASPISDRLEQDPEAHGALVASIREHGQQVPILVRPHPDQQGRYQVAYGRRRLRAALELGQPVRAVVKALSDQELVVAQGQENSARTDLSFIEKAAFAAKLEEGGFGRETIMAALSVDKTGLSRLISAAVKIPRDILNAIGPAPGAGRDRWMTLAGRLNAESGMRRAHAAIADPGFAIRPSDQRFVIVFSAAAPRQPKLSRPTIWRAPDGTRVARIQEDAASVILAIDKTTSAAFADYLRGRLPDIYAAFKGSEQDG